MAKLRQQIEEKEMNIVRRSKDIQDLTKELAKNRKELEDIVKKKDSNMMEILLHIDRMEQTEF